MNLQEFKIEDYDGDFILLSEFDKLAKSKCLIPYDGWGYIIYVDKNAKMLIDKDSSIFDDGVKFENEEQFPVAVMWYNR